MNDALFTKIASSPALDAKQQAVLTKMSRNQIKARGGFDALRVSMEDAGVPFTDEQLPQVQAMFEEQKKSREEEKAYKDALSRIPVQKPVDPWAKVR